MYADRIFLYQQLEQKRTSRLLVYVTGDRPGLETQIHPEIYDYFVNHLDRLGVVPKISLYLYTRVALRLLHGLLSISLDNFATILRSLFLRKHTVLVL